MDVAGPEPIRFNDGDTTLTGWLQQPEGEPRGAILIMPTIGNRGPAMDRRAAMLAEAGFLVMIADFYGRQPESFEDAQALAEPLRAEVSRYRKRLRANFDKLREASGSLRIAVIGYCMGGQAALELARDKADITAVVSFHGILSTDAPANDGVSGRILVCHGDKDPLVPREQVTAFQKEMDAAGADWQINIHGHARHGFTDPASDERNMDFLGYDAAADRHSWAAMMVLLDELYGAPAV